MLVVYCGCVIDHTFYHPGEYNSDRGKVKPKLQKALMLTFIAGLDACFGAGVVVTGKTS